MASDEPTPTQAEADAFRSMSHGSVPWPPAVNAPTYIDVPHLSGTGIVGETLSCTLGNWTGEPSFYSYSWRWDGVAELGTGDSYVVADTDVGHSITCVVIAWNAAGANSAPPSNAVVGTAA